jgi:hypothetical protein
MTASVFILVAMGIFYLELRINRPRSIVVSRSFISLFGCESSCICLKSIMKGSDGGVMHIEESWFWTISIVQCFLFKIQRFGSWFCFRLQVQWLRLALFKGPHRVGATPPPFFHLKTEAEPASETLFLKKKHWTMDIVQKQDSSICICLVSYSLLKCFTSAIYISLCYRILLPCKKLTISMKSILEELLFAQLVIKHLPSSKVPCPVQKRPLPDCLEPADSKSHIIIVDYIGSCDGARLCLSTAAWWLVVLSSVESECDRVCERDLLGLTPNLTTRDLWRSRRWARGIENFVYSSVWDFKSSFTCRKILRHGTFPLYFPS